MLPRLPEKMETPFVLIRKGICLSTDRSSLPMTLRQTCLQRHVIEMIRHVTGLYYQGCFLFQFLSVLLQFSKQVTAKVGPAMLSQCKYSGTGQNEIKLPCILFCKGTYSTRVSWVDSWTLSFYFVPERPKTKMQRGWSLPVRSSLPVQRRA